MFSAKIPIPALLTLLIISYTSFAGLATNPQSTASNISTQHDLTRPLHSGAATFLGQVIVSNLPPLEAGQSPSQSFPIRHLSREELPKSFLNSMHFAPPGEESKTIVGGRTAVEPTAQTVSTSLTLEGTPGSTPNPCGCSPPDPNLGVGLNHVFEMSNLAGIIYTKTGAIAKATFGLDSFFNLPASSMSDPEIMYDSSSGHWFASIVNIGASRVQFAVSNSSDPTGTFNLFSVATSSTRFAPDQPFIGTNDNLFVISANIFDSRNNAYVGVEYWALNKSDAVSGVGSIRFVTNVPDSSMISLHPARHQTSTSAFYLVTDCVGTCVTDLLSTTSSVQFVILTGTPPATVTVTKKSFSISTSSAPPDAQQPGTNTLLKTNDNRVLSAVWENNTLWFSASDACIPLGDTATRSCIRLIEASTSGILQPVKLQDFDYASTGEYLFYPALSAHQGQVAVVFGKSSSAIFPSLLVTGRSATDSPNTLQSPSIIKSGKTPDLSGRYGDYFGAATDPAPTIDSTFWVAGEYRSSSVNSAWNTAIARVGSLAIISVIVSDSRVFGGFNVTSTGSLTVNNSNSTLAGGILVTARNATTGTIVYSKLYNITNLALQSMHGKLQASILLNVQVLPSPLSSDITVTIANGAASLLVQATKEPDVAGAGFVSIVDLGFVYQDYGRAAGDSLFEPTADLDGNGVVTITDIGIVTFYFAAHVLR